MKPHRVISETIGSVAKLRISEGHFLLVSNSAITTPLNRSPTIGQIGRPLAARALRESRAASGGDFHGSFSRGSCSTVRIAA